MLEDLELTIRRRLDLSSKKVLLIFRNKQSIINYQQKNGIPLKRKINSEHDNQYFTTYGECRNFILGRRYKDYKFM